MNDSWKRRVVWGLGLLAWASAVCAELVDPCFPEPRHAGQVAAPSPLRRWLPARIRQLEDERVLLLDQIADLPQHNPEPLSDHFGCHSEPIEVGAESLTQIDIVFDFDPELGAIALVPAFVPDVAGAYAFPKRFRIDVLESGGRWVGGEIGRWMRDETLQKWTEVANWMDEDFPDPGLYPVFFEWTGRTVYQVRITVPRHQPGADAAFYALGEIYLFRQKPNGRLGDNMAVWGDTVHISASGLLLKAPFWDVRYLYDGVVGLGMPLSEETEPVEDLMLEWDSREGGEEPVSIVLDLGKIRQVGRVQLWPAEAPHGMAIPRFGFPGKVLVELSATPAFDEVHRVEVENTHQRMYRNNLLNIITGAFKARYVRVTLSDLGEYRGKRILGLGEIRVAEFDDVWSLNCRVSAEGLSDAGREQLPRLVDGFSRHRRILREADWIKGLAMRRPLDRRLAVVERELLSARDAWRLLQLRLSIGGVAVLLLATFAGWGILMRNRRTAENKLKQRIARDLHDDVGSNLGSISLITERLESDIRDESVKEDLGDLALLAREAVVSLRDVVWVVDQNRIRLQDLLQKLRERAERVLDEIDLSVEFPSSLPNVIVPLSFKRHLIMFFKEAVHNCAQHSGADRVWIKVTITEQLNIVFGDNGCGFDPSAQSDGWGLESMKKRAEELGGTVTIDSCPGEGTTVKFSVPMSALPTKTDHLYKTSN